MPLGFSRSIFSKQPADGVTVYSEAEYAYDMTTNQVLWTWRNGQYAGLNPPHHLNDINEFTVSFWFKHPDPYSEAFEPFMAPFNPETDEILLRSNYFSVRGQGYYINWNTVDADPTNGVPLYANTWHHFMMSYKYAASGSAQHFYFDGVEMYSTYTKFTDNPIADGDSLSTLLPDYAVAGRPGTADYNGYLSQFWQTDEYIDLSNSVNRSKFYASGSPVDLGSDGSTPTGNQPLVFLDGFNQSNQGTLGDDLFSGTLTTTTGPGP